MFQLTVLPAHTSMAAVMRVLWLFALLFSPLAWAFGPAPRSPETEEEIFRQIGREQVASPEAFSLRKLFESAPGGAELIRSPRFALARVYACRTFAVLKKGSETEEIPQSTKFEFRAYGEWIFENRFAPEYSPFQFFILWPSLPHELVSVGSSSYSAFETIRMLDDGDLVIEGSGSLEAWANRNALRILRETREWRAFSNFALPAIAVPGAVATHYSRCTLD